MNKISTNIPFKKLQLPYMNIKIGRLSSKLTFIRNLCNIKIEYNKFYNFKYYNKRKKNNFYKFTGKIKTSIEYKKYITLYPIKYLQYKLKHTYF